MTTRGTQYGISLTKAKGVKVWYREPNVYGCGFRETSVLSNATMFQNKSLAEAERGRLIRGGHHPENITVIPIHFVYEM